MSASRTPLLRLLAPLLGLALLLGACSDDGKEDDEGNTKIEQQDPADTPKAADVPDPCRLLTSADVQAQFGSPFADGEVSEQAGAGARQCTWINTDAPPAKTFTIVVGSDASLQAAFGRDASEFFALTRSALETSDSIDEPDLGLGDESYRAGAFVYVLDGESTYTFSTFMGEGDDAVTGLKALATQVVGG